MVAACLLALGLACMSCCLCMSASCAWPMLGFVQLVGLVLVLLFCSPWSVFWLACSVVRLCTSAPHPFGGGDAMRLLQACPFVVLAGGWLMLVVLGFLGLAFCCFSAFSPWSSGQGVFAWFELVVLLLAAGGACRLVGVTLVWLVFGRTFVLIVPRWFQGALFQVLWVLLCGCWWLVLPCSVSASSRAFLRSVTL